MKAGEYRLIPKGNGKTRKILVTNKKFRHVNRKLLPALHGLQEKVCCYYLDGEAMPVVHGFWWGRSPVTNALQHVGFRWSVCFDLENFFPSVTKEKFLKALQQMPSEYNAITRNPLFQYVFIDHEAVTTSYMPSAIAEQGIPTSPLIANIAAAPLDRELIWRGALYTKHVYTRYADDLTFSTNDYDVVQRLLQSVPEVAAKHGFTVNAAKTHVLDARRGRRIITGVGVDDTGVHPTRDVKRRLRAARHNGWTRKAAGLEEWSKLKTPGDTRRKIVMRKMAYLMRDVASGAKRVEHAQNICVEYRRLSDDPAWVAAWNEAIQILGLMA